MSDISSESSFCGSETEKQRLEDEVAAYDTSAIINASETILESALIGIAAKPKVSKALERRHNAFADDPQAWQLDEDISDFLARLPASTFPADPNNTWIRAASPECDCTQGDLAGFRKAGEELLADLSVWKHKLHGSGHEPHIRSYSQHRKAHEDAIIDAAKEKGVKGGKWMLFVSVAEVDEVWEIVAKGTIEGKLGCAAKVACDDGTAKSKSRVICVYTKDFGDVADVKRVLLELDTRGLLAKRGPMGEGRPIYYKTEAWTHLGISSGNEWEIQASLYSSRDLLETRAVKRKGRW